MITIVKNRLPIANVFAIGECTIPAHTAQFIKTKVRANNCGNGMITSLEKDLFNLKVNIVAIFAEVWGQNDGCRGLFGVKGH